MAAEPSKTRVVIEIRSFHGDLPSSLNFVGIRTGKTQKKVENMKYEVITRRGQKVMVVLGEEEMEECQ